MDGCGAVGGQSVDWSPDVGPTLMLYLGDATFSQHVVTYMAEHLELLNLGQCSAFGTLLNGLDEVCFEHWSLALMNLV